MSDTKRTTGMKAPVNARFVVEWTTDAYVECVNRLKITDKEELRDVGARPSKRPEKGKPAIHRGNVVCTTTVTRDGVDVGFPADTPAPTHTERGAFTATTSTYTHVYKLRYTPRAEGKYEFLTVVEGTVNNAPSRKEFITEVEVTPEELISQKRKDLVKTCERWLPTSILGAKTIPEGDTDLMDRTGWRNDSPSHSWNIPDPPRAKNDPSPMAYETLPMQPQATFVQNNKNVTAVGQGQISAAKSSYNNNVLPKRIQTWQALVDKDKADHEGNLVHMEGVARPTAEPVTTSCIDIANKLVEIWGGAFPVNVYAMAPDKDHPPRPYYRKAKETLKADPGALPKPGDILFLGKPGTPGEFQHVCILISRTSNLWVTADGGGGALPEQTASLSDKPVEMTKGAPPVPMIISVTDNKNKVLHGWIDLDAAPHPGYNDKGEKI